MDDFFCLLSRAAAAATDDAGGGRGSSRKEVLAMVNRCIDWRDSHSRPIIAQFSSVQQDTQAQSRLYF